MVHRISFRMSLKTCTFQCETSSNLEGFPQPVTLLPTINLMLNIFTFHKHNMKLSSHEMLHKYEDGSYLIPSSVHPPQNNDISLMALKRRCI